MDVAERVCVMVGGLELPPLALRPLMNDLFVLVR